MMRAAALLALASAAAATPTPLTTRMNGRVTSHLQELNLEQVRANGTAHTPGHSLLPRASGAY
jgi:hypothetical protein